MKSHSYPCKHPETARKDLPGIPPAFKCKKCGREVVKDQPVTNEVNQ